jgi:hypothetical protein
MTRLKSNFEHNDMDESNVDIAGEPRQLLDLLSPNKSDRLSSEDYLENDTSESVGPSITARISRASVVFVFLFLVLAIVGAALSWRYYGEQGRRLVRAWALPGATSKPTVPPEGFAELQQQLKSIAVDLAAVRHTLEQQSAANHDQLTRIQEQIAQQNIALQATKQERSQKLSSSTPADKPVHTPLPKPAQHSAHVSAQDSPKPVHVASPQSPVPPKQ